VSDSLRELADALAQPEGQGGSALAAELGVTRAAVWKRIERLRAMGLAIEPGARRRYRLARPIDWLDRERIRRALSREARAVLGTLELHFELDSTSSEWSRRGPALASGSVCLAEWQSAGRGRRGRAWSSTLGAGICCSVIWRYEQGLSALAGLSLAVALALRRGLHALGLAPVGLKWPNDLQHRDVKLGGILVEASGESTGPCSVVIGFGVNVHDVPQAVDYPGRAITCADRIAEDGGHHAPDRNAIAAALLDALLPALARFGQEGFAPLRREWQEADALAGHRIEVQAGGESYAATAAGVDDAGCLRVRVGGRERTLASAEVSVRTAP